MSGFYIGAFIASTLYTEQALQPQKYLLKNKISDNVIKIRNRVEMVVRRKKKKARVSVGYQKSES